MSVEGYYRNLPENEEDDSVDVHGDIRKITSMIAPIIVPMLESMAELNMADI